MAIPVKEKDIVDIEISNINHKGQGVGVIDGFTVFVDGGLIGDKAKTKITTVKKNYAIGEMIELLHPSEHRVDTRCPVVNVCGGCQIQSLSYEAQLNIKTDKVKNDISRIGKLDGVKIHDTLGMEDPYYYRNKAQFPVAIRGKNIKFGFYERGTHNIVDIKSCVIQHEVNDKILEILKTYMKKFNISVYDEKTGRGVIRNILTRTSFKTKDVMVVVITNGRDLPHKLELVELLQKNVPNLKSLIHNINNMKTNRILGDKTITLYGDDKIIDYIGDLKFKISALSFFQVNPMQTEVLYEKTLEYADLTGDETVFDLYCGIGSISLFLAKKAKKVYGIEIVKEAIEDARENAKINHIDNAEFYTGKAEEIFPRLYEQGIKADVVIIDPPRKGCEEEVLNTIIEMQPKKVIYVSCNPSTLARDLKYLDEHGYKTVEIQPVDMFPHTMHVETVVKLQRK